MPDNGTSTDVQAFILALIGGEYDADLLKIAEALGARLQLGEVANTWRMDLRDIHLTEDDLTFEEMVLWSNLADRSWIMLRPLDQDILVCRALLMTLIKTRLKLTGKKADAMLESFTAREVVQAFTDVVSPSPLDDGNSD